MQFNDIFNNETVNIFCDASIVTLDTETIGCTGVCVVVGDNAQQIYDHQRVIRNSTNNNSEIRAIADALYYAMVFNPDRSKNVNIFSDSLICIKGLNEWIYKWIREYNTTGRLQSTSGEVKNQDIIISILNTIIRNRIQLRFYHQKGHVNRSNIHNALEVFKKSNYLKYVDMSLIEKISEFNNFVDVSSRDYLHHYMENYYDPNVRVCSKVIDPVLDFDSDLYFRLTKQSI